MRHTSTRRLDGGWSFRELDPTPMPFTDTTRWLPAQVPGHVHLYLMRLGVIPDPFERMYERTVQWVDETDWAYRCAFTIAPDELAGGRRHVAAPKERDMSIKADSWLAARRGAAAWLRYLLIAAVLEKIVQHVAVTLAFYFDWAGIRSTVVVPPDLLLLLGAIIAGLFGLSLWGIVARRCWAINLVAALAICDITGEYIAQGRLGIVVTVSFLVATLLLVLVLLYRRAESA